MLRTKYQDSAMDYTIGYQEHLLELEDVLSAILERKMKLLLAEKLQQMIEKGVIPASVLNDETILEMKADSSE